MELTPEEKRRIYEEEKERIEAEQKQEKSQDIPSLDLPKNVASTLCYVLFWITGIIFLVLEKKDKTVNFHAIQSIVFFGSLTVLSSCLSWIPYAGGFFGAAIGIVAFIFWIVLMVKTYQGEIYKVPLAGDIAESIHNSVWKDDTAADETGEDAEKAKGNKAEEAAAAVSQKADAFGKKVDNYFNRTRTGRVVGYGFAIFWNVVLIIFFTMFYKYIAWYSVGDDGSLVIMPILTPDFLLWLPILITSLSICIAANVILIFYDRYWFREAVQILLELIGLAVVIYLVIIFPFNFSVIPNAVAAEILPTVAKAVLIFVSVALGISAVIRFVKMVLNIENREYTD